MRPTVQQAGGGGEEREIKRKRESERERKTFGGACHVKRRKKNVWEFLARVGVRGALCRRIKKRPPYVRVFERGSVCMCVYACVCVCTGVCVRECVYVCVCVCVCVRVLVTV
jgi:hypothetical protein